MSLPKLREFLATCQPGELIDRRRVAGLLADCWVDLEGSGAEGMSAAKLSRIEEAIWNPPILTFRVERHGATVMGSTRAEIQSWTLDTNRGTVECDTNVGFRQLWPRDSPLRIGPMVDEIVGLIAARKADPRLKWLPKGAGVRILVSRFITEQFKQTEQGRRRRFRQALKDALTAAGWEEVKGRRDAYRPTEER